MSILVRTGNGITDLKYVDSATKGLKVLQKTGNKTVQWITTAAGTTYQNILQKRGVKDLFYGSITIPADVPSWAANPTSGTHVFTSDGPYESDRVGEFNVLSPTGYINIHNNNMFPSEKINSVKWKLNDMVLRGNSFSIMTNSGVSSLLFRWLNNRADYPDDWLGGNSLTNPERLIKKLFVLDNNTKEAYVVLTTTGVYDSNSDGYYYGYTNIFSNIKSINNSHTYTVGIRSTVS